MKIIYVALMALCLASCATKPEVPDVALPAPLPALNIYQPSILTLTPGTPVQTEGGIYTPQTREVWHSDKRYRDLERAGY